MDSKGSALFFSNSFDDLQHHLTETTDLQSLALKLRRVVIVEEDLKSTDLTLQITKLFRFSSVLGMKNIPDGMPLIEFLRGKSPFIENSGTDSCLIVNRLHETSDQGRLYELLEFLHAYPHHAVFITVSERFLANDPALQRLPGFVYAREKTTTYSDPVSNREEIKESTSSPKKQAPTEEPVFKLETNIQRKIDGFTGKIYAVGTMWSGEDRLEQFIDRGCWDSEGNENFIPIVKGILPGDILVAKAVRSLKVGNLFRIKAIGKVQKNHNDGFLLDVHWIMSANKDIPGRLSRFNSRIAAIGLSDFAEIVSHLEPSKRKQLLSNGVLENGNATAPKAPTPAGLPATASDTFYRTSICNDFDGADTLGFDRDAKSLAALIALKEMRPPLAIVLFGRWGSGKSFFMKLLEKRIRELSDYQGFLEKEQPTAPQELPAEKLFHDGIAHIRFNAWSYIDANLWAGLSHSLFEKLNEYITQNTKNTVEKLNVQIKIAKRLDILYSDLQQFKEKQSQLVLLKDRLEAERERKILRYFKAENYDKAVTHLLKTNGFDDEEIQAMTPSAIQKQIRKGISFLTYLKSNGYYKGMLVIAAMLILVLAIVSFEPLQKAWVSMLAVITPVFIPLATFLRSKRKALKKIKASIDLVERPRSDEAMDDEMKKLYAQLEEIDELREEIKTSIDSEYSKTTNITQIAIANFISVKPDQQDYRKHLGIITTIRKDFETLSELFAEQDAQVEALPFSTSKEEKKELKKLNDDKQSIRDSFHENQRLERIVLYIDDLDRCSDEKIMEVLEAIHLLMAFPLFTVVVGVDERSVYNALMNRRLERYRGIDESVVKEHIVPVEPHEYLEKIFQIPFQLPEANKEHISKFIDALVPKTTDQEPVAAVAKEYVQISDTLETEAVIREPDVGYTKAASAGETLAEVAEPAVQKPVPLKAVTPSDISISTTEKQLLLDFSPLIGKNPRALKRFVNIFRITKVYSHLRAGDEAKSQEIIFLIALTSGDFDGIANDWISDEGSALLNFKNSDPVFSKVLQELDNNPDYQAMLTKSAAEFRNELEFIQRFSYNLNKQQLN